MHMDMDMEMTHGTPWLDQPVMLHSSRKYKCSLNDTVLCDWQQGYWRFWYEADHRYALPTVAFFMVAIILFAIPFFLAAIWPNVASARSLRRGLALNRYLSYRRYRIGSLNWNSAPLGVLFLGAVGTIFFFAMSLGPRPYNWPNSKDPPISFGNSPPLATRTGWMSLACLPFVFATSSKSNMVTAVTGISHERLQVFHRWISYAMFVLALIHTFPFIVFHIWKGDMMEEWDTSSFYWTGVVAVIAQAYLTFAAFSPLRNWCYEWFKFSHFVAALVFAVFFFLHCDFRLSSWDYFIATGGIYSLSWLHSVLRTFFQHGIGRSATIHLMSNGFIRVSIPTQTTWRAGQHFFIRFLGLGIHAWTAHPFTACSLPTKAHFYEARDSELIFYIRPQGGFTARLAKYAEKHPGCKMRVLLDGPYGGIDMPKLVSPEKMLVLAGGSGAGWCLPLIESFLRRKDCYDCCVEGKRDCNIPSMRVILATRDLATRNWFEEAVNELVSSSLIGKCPPGLVVEVHYTGGEANATDPKATGQFLQKLDDPEKAPDADVAITAHEVPESSSSDLEAEEKDERRTRFALSLRDFSSRPYLPDAIREECQGEEKMGVFVCGPLSMQSDVANAVAREQVKEMREGKRDLYLHMEHFSWA